MYSSRWIKSIHRTGTHLYIFCRSGRHQSWPIVVLAMLFKIIKIKKKSLFFCRLSHVLYGCARTLHQMLIGDLSDFVVALL